MHLLLLTRRSAPTLAAIASATVLLTAASSAFANSRYPYANQLIVHSSDKTKITMRTTYGLLHSTDSGHTFNWTCEQIIGFTNGTDPGLAVFQDDSVAVSGFYGLAISHDGMCSFPFVTGDLVKQYVVDVTADKDTPASGVALTATEHTDGTNYVQMFQTTDDGTTWAKAGVELGGDIIATTLDRAPSDTTRVYVAGAVIANGARSGILIRSSDNGAHWARTTYDNVTALFVSGIDPKNPNRVYVRALDAQAGQDLLLVSDDGGATLREVTRAQSTVTSGGLLGFALSPDGSTVAVGGPLSGLMMASSTDLKFSQVSKTPVYCLTWTPDTLYVCGAARPGYFVLGSTNDQGQTFTTLVQNLTDIQGPTSACGPSTPAGTTCVADWPRQKAVLADPLKPPGSDAGLSDAGDAGAKGDGGPAPIPGDDCLCTAVAAPRDARSSRAWLGALLGLAALARRRRAIRR